MEKVSITEWEILPKFADIIFVIFLDKVTALHLTCTSAYFSGVPYKIIPTMRRLIWESKVQKNWLQKEQSRTVFIRVGTMGLKGSF